VERAPDLTSRNPIYPRQGLNALHLTCQKKLSLRHFTRRGRYWCKRKRRVLTRSGYGHIDSSLHWTTRKDELGVEKVIHILAWRDNGSALRSALENFFILLVWHRIRSLPYISWVQFLQLSHCSLWQLKEVKIKRLLPMDAPVLIAEESCSMTTHKHHVPPNALCATASKACSVRHRKTEKWGLATLKNSPNVFIGTGTSHRCDLYEWA
jgi:hypothetical protein